MAGEKSEKATGHRRSQERKKGNVFQSKDVVMVFSLLVMFYTLQSYAPQLLDSLERTIILFIEKGITLTWIDPPIVTQLTIEAIQLIVFSLIPIFLFSILASVVATAFQTKMLVTFETMKFKFDKLNPISGLKNLFSLRGIIELAKAVVKFIAISIVCYVVLVARIESIPSLMDMSIMGALVFLGETVMSLVTTVGVIFIVVAIGDYFYQRYEYEKKIRMSKQDIKEEYKQLEGDPKIKNKRKQKQLQMAQKRMMQAVPTADVIIRNPTHYAVALSYDSEKHAAPIVVAKGADYLALKIIDTAKEHDVVITENRPLARSLYESVELEHPIPEKFYTAVAEVLAFVYSLKKKGIK